MMEHEREHTIREQLYKLSNIEYTTIIRHNSLDSIFREQINGSKKEHQNGYNSHANNDNLHNFSFINTSKTETSPRNKEQEHPKIELFQIVHIYKHFRHNFSSHYTF